MNRRALRLLAMGAFGVAAAAALLREARALSLEGKTVVIMGGSRGLGLLMAREFARHGAHIALCARDAQEIADATADLHRRGAIVHADMCDVTDERQVVRFIDQVLTRFGRIDVLVNNAGVISAGPATAFSLDDFDEAMDVMFHGMLHATWAALPHMIARRSGSIVNITSIGGMISVPHLLPYCSAKHAAVGFSQGLHAEMAQHNIRVTTVVPGLMRIGSHLNAEFRGNAELEFKLFALGATVPFVSIKAERAARKIVSAARHGDAVAFIGAQANVAARLSGLVPDLTARSMAAVNAALPRDDGRGEALRGSEADQRIDSGMFAAATALGRSAAKRTHQLSGGAARSAISVETKPLKGTAAAPRKQPFE